MCIGLRMRGTFLSPIVEPVRNDSGTLVDATPLYARSRRSRALLLPQEPRLSTGCALSEQSCSDAKGAAHPAVGPTDGKK